MDVDRNPSSPAAAAGGEAAAARSIKIHPLAIIGISDHHTRVVAGGSALPPSAPVVGLLFGYCAAGSGAGHWTSIPWRDVSIVDAEEMEYPAPGEGDGSERQAAVLQKIELHQTVFPHHKVVGWYRVQKGDGAATGADGAAPSEEDLRMNQTEMQRYCNGGQEGGGEDGDVQSPLFVLMNAAKSTEAGDKKPSASGKAAEEMDVDEELPLTVYETLDAPEASGGGAVFVDADFELETYEPERIAVEKVFKTQPTKAAAVSVAAKDAPAKKEEGGERKAGKKSKKDEKEQAPSRPPFTRGPTELDGQVDSLQSSVRAMNLRMNVLLEFLQKVERGEIAADDGLLRSVDGLVRQLPLVLAALEEGRAVASSDGDSGRTPLRELENERRDTMLLTYLAAVAKTAQSVHVYSEKFRSACEGGKAGDRRPLF
ncbi:hypothetical protein ACHAXT_010802 [Thalassiosira profunda]